MQQMDHWRIARLARTMDRGHLARIGILFTAESEEYAELRMLFKDPRLSVFEIGNPISAQNLHRFTR
jgi:hypothetical protein